MHATNNHWWSVDHDNLYSGYCFLCHKELTIKMKVSSVLVNDEVVVPPAIITSKFDNLLIGMSK